MSQFGCAGSLSNIFRLFPPRSRSLRVKVVAVDGVFPHSAFSYGARCSFLFPPPAFQHFVPLPESVLLDRVIRVVFVSWSVQRVLSLPSFFFCCFFPFSFSFLFFLRV